MDKNTPLYKLLYYPKINNYRLIYNKLVELSIIFRTFQKNIN